MAQLLLFVPHYFTLKAIDFIFLSHFPARRDGKRCLVLSLLDILKIAKVSSCLETRSQRTCKSCLVSTYLLLSWVVLNLLVLKLCLVLSCLEKISRLCPCLVLSRLEIFLSRPIPVLKSLISHLGVAFSISNKDLISRKIWMVEK